jgi:hypothetical protein
MSTPGRSLSYHRSRVCLTASVHGGSTNFAGSLRPTGWVGPKGGGTAYWGAAGRPGPSGGVSALPLPSVSHASHMECTMGGVSSALGCLPVIVRESSSNLWQPTSRVGPGVNGSLLCRLRQGGSDARSDAVPTAAFVKSDAVRRCRLLTVFVRMGWTRGRTRGWTLSIGVYGPRHHRRLRRVGRCQAV